MRRLQRLNRKEHAGKSNILSAIDVVLNHLRNGTPAASWAPRGRAAEEFTDRDTSRRIQLGAEFALDEPFNTSLREQLKAETTQYERAIDQIANQSSISVVISGSMERGSPFLFLEEATVGPVVVADDLLTTNGIKLISISPSVASELFRNERDASGYRMDLTALDRVVADPALIDFAFRERDPNRLSYIVGRIGDAVRPSLQKQLEAVFRASADSEQFVSGVAQLSAQIRGNIGAVEQRETTAPMTAFAGDVKTPPAYVAWLMKQLGELPKIHFRETKQPIGPEEAAALLRLKVRRGGEERLAAVKQTVRALLGVSVDAFEPEDPTDDRRPVQRGQRRIAEMDINDFIVEANGAGIREALRIVLDLELKAPRLVLIEEPEVHLHPGLEQALHSYLLGKSDSVQMFVTTHSTNFIDAASLQNVYLVSRDDQRKTVVETVAVGEGALRIPSELGLRLSTVFMFDRLIFVEGRSDEDILRELAKKEEVDLTRANVGFVQMGGVRNFASFAAESTLEILSRRQIKMWFITDRDEKDDAEVKAMVNRLGENARLIVLKCREIENYLLDAKAFGNLLLQKGVIVPTDASERETAIAAALREAAIALKDEVIRLRVERKLLRPLYLQSRTLSGTPVERFNNAIADIQKRITSLESIQEQVSKEIEEHWESRALCLAPGAMILDGAARRFGGRFVKEVDGVKLARNISRSGMNAEVAALLREVAKE